MNTISNPKSGFSKFVLVLWIAIVFVLFFLLLPVFNTFKKEHLNSNSSNGKNTSFHFESWNQEVKETNSSDK